MKKSTAIILVLMISLLSISVFADDAKETIEPKAIGLGNCYMDI